MTYNKIRHLELLKRFLDFGKDLYTENPDEYKSGSWPARHPDRAPTPGRRARYPGPARTCLAPGPGCVALHHVALDPPPTAHRPGAGR